MVNLQKAGRIGIPVLGALTVATAATSAACCLDADIQSFYFTRGAVLPVLFAIITVAFVLCTAVYAFRQPETPIPAYFDLPRAMIVWPALPALGILLCLVQPLTAVIRGGASWLQLAFFLLSLAGAVYFVTLYAPEREAGWRLVCGILFMLQPVIWLITSLTDWSVPLNAPFKVLFQLAAMSVSLFVCEELRQQAGNGGRRLTLFAAALCAVLCPAEAMALLCGNMVGQIADAGAVTLLLCMGIYAGGRLFPLLCISDTIPQPTEEKEDEHHAGE